MSLTQVLPLQTPTHYKGLPLKRITRFWLDHGRAESFELTVTKAELPLLTRAAELFGGRPVQLVAILADGRRHVVVPGRGGAQ